MQTQASVTAAAVLLTEEAPQWLALCIAYFLDDPRFGALMDGLVQLDPERWPETTEFVQGLLRGGAGERS